MEAGLHHNQAGAVLHKQEAGAVLHKQEEAGAVLHKQEEAGHHSCAVVGEHRMTELLQEPHMLGVAEMVHMIEGKLNWQEGAPEGYHSCHAVQVGHMMGLLQLDDRMRSCQLQFQGCQGYQHPLLQALCQQKRLDTRHWRRQADNCHTWQRRRKVLHQSHCWGALY
jgi:hypothetical protein